MRWVCGIYLVALLAEHLISESVSFQIRSVHQQHTRQPTKLWAEAELPSKAMAQKRRQRRRSEAASGQAAPGSGPPTPSSQNTSRPASPLRKGDLPNVEWRAVPRAHLREHPLYCSLPEPDVVMGHLNSSAQFPLLTQDSWQWGALHQGRLTTSCVGGVLGFHESQSAVALKLPPSLTSGGKALSARATLLEPVPTCYVTLLKEMDRRMPGKSARPSPKDGAASKIWLEQEKDKAPFPYAYKPPKVSGQPERVRVYDSVGPIRMTWGNTQEATAILCALNHFSKGGATVCEAGLFPLEAVYPSFEAIVQVSNTYTPNDCSSLNG